MNSVQSIQCLLDKGLITEGEAQDYKDIAGALLGVQTQDLLAILIALQLRSLSGADSFDDEILGVESITSTDTVDIQGFDTVPVGATYAMVTVSGNNIIYREDGANPTSPSGGNYQLINTKFRVDDLAAFKFISTSTTDAILFVTYY